MPSLETVLNVIQMRRFKKLQWCYFLCLILLSACQQQSEGLNMSSLDDIKDKRIGVWVGSVYDKYTADHFPEATVVHLDATPDLVVALINNKCDVFMIHSELAAHFMAQYPEIGLLYQYADTDTLAYGFNPENTRLQQQFNAFIHELGYEEIQTICDKWAHNFNHTPPPLQEGDGSGGILRMGTTGTDVPCSSTKDGRPAGYDIELVYKFAAKHNMKVEVSRMQFGSLIAALSTGKVDVIGNGIMITPERQKKILFSDFYRIRNFCFLALKKNITTYAEEVAGQETEAAPQVSFFQSLTEGFKSNIMTEKRYLIILEGLLTTIIITFFTVLIGTLWGGVICLLRMSRHKLWKGIGDLYVTILSGIPLLVFLMIMFYIVFAGVNISAVTVAIIALALAFGAYVSRIYKTAIESIDAGQREAGIAMGFTRTETFWYIIFPQAVRRALPIYKGEVISMLKNTSIVGYIAVEDLTKAGDIIRSRTFDAFFPLIVVALAYFLLAWLLSVLLTKIAGRNAVY